MVVVVVMVLLSHMFTMQSLKGQFLNDVLSALRAIMSEQGSLDLIFFFQRE